MSGYNGEQSPARNLMIERDELNDRDWLAGLIDMMGDHAIITLDELEDYAWRAKYERNSQED